MITMLINDLLNFLNSLFSLMLLYWVLKLVFRYSFGIRFRLPRFRNARAIRVGMRPKRYNKAEYELRKFKYETKLKYRNQYKIEKLKLKMGEKENHRGFSSKLASSLPDYLKIIK